MIISAPVMVSIEFNRYCIGGRIIVPDFCNGLGIEFTKHCIGVLLIPFRPADA